MRRATEERVIKRLIAVLAVLSLCVSAPGCSTLWAEGVALIAGESGAATGVRVVPQINPQASPGGSALSAGVPAGWMKTGGGLWVPGAGLKSKRLTLLPAERGEGPARRLAGDEGERPSEPVADIVSQPGFTETVDALQPEQIQEAPAEDSRGAGERLQGLVERAGKQNEETKGAIQIFGAYAPIPAERKRDSLSPSPLPSPRRGEGESLPSSALRAPSPRSAGRRAYNGVGPALGGAGDRPDSLRAAVLHGALWVRAVKHFLIDLSVENWREYKAEREARQKPGAVSDSLGFFTALEEMDPSRSRHFFTELRLMGFAGAFNVRGSLSGSDEFVRAEALRIFHSYFDSPKVTPEAKRAFNNFLVRVSFYNPARRSGNLRKRIRKVLQEASLAAPERLEAFFDGQLSLPREALAAYQRGQQRRDLEQFQEAALQTLREERSFSERPEKRVVAVVLMGSFMSGAATPTSDLDIQLITQDGGSERVAGFLERLKVRWGRIDHPVSPVLPFALPPSRGLLLRLHQEPYAVVSADPRLQRNLSPPPGAYDSGKPAPPEMTSWRRLKAGAYRALVGGVLRVADLVDAQAPVALDPATRKRALRGFIASVLLSISAFILTSIAYRMLVTDLVGGGGYTNLMSLGSMAGIGLGAFSGRLIGRMTLRNATAMNMAARGATGLAMFVLIHFAPMLLPLTVAGAPVVLYGLLMGVSLVVGWNMSSIFITQDKFLSEISTDKDRQGNNALLQLVTVGLSVLLTIFFGWGGVVDFMIGHFGRMAGLSYVFLGSALVHFPFDTWLVWKTIPNVRPTPKNGTLSPAPSPVNGRGEGEGSSWKVWAGRGAAVAAGAAAALWLGNTLPLVLALIGCLVTGRSFAALRRDPVLLTAAGLSMLGAGLFYPVQEVVIPFAANQLDGTGLLQGRLFGALYFGQLLAISTRLNLPGKWNWVAQGSVLAGMAVWLFFYLYPFNLAALGIGMAAAGALFFLVSSLTDRGWIKLNGLGLSFIFLAALLWGDPVALFASIMMIGLFNGPMRSTLDSIYQKSATPGDMGVKGALTNAGIALSYALMGLTVGHDKHVAIFPGAFWPMGAVFMLGAAVFWIVEKKLKGRVSHGLFKCPSWLKRWLPWKDGGPARAALRIGLRRAFAAAAALLLAGRAAAPALSEPDGLALLEARVREHGIKVIVADWDGTLEDKTADNRATPASPELIALLRELCRRTGVSLVVSTNHFFDGDGNAMTALLADRLAPEDRAGTLYVTQSGSAIYEYGADGKKPERPLWQAAPFDDAERARITPAFEAAAREAGLEPGDWKLVHEDSRTLIELHRRQERLPALERALQRANDAAGWGYEVQAKPMPTMRGVPYVQYGKARKGRGTRVAYETLKARGLVDREEQVLILGDDFKPGGNDLHMAQELPGALAISMGRGATARQPNVFQWKTPGAAGTRRILREVLKLLEGWGA